MDNYLNDMALFVEIVKAGGFRSAASATGIPNSTLSRRIGELEKSIGLRLLHRTTRKIELTEAGQIYYERCRCIVDEARLVHEQLGEMQTQPSGVLRASLPVDFAVTYPDAVSLCLTRLPSTIRRTGQTCRPGASRVLWYPETGGLDAA